ncbi:MAG: GNAT family N-acetyltransferase [Bryobacterales bacterium]|nr:GNAT family N-acetyltransferase [Bryobacterales bacterium]
MIRPATAADLPRVAAIQAASPEAAQWPVADYLEYSFYIAELAGEAAGFAVWRAAGEGEWELLNLAVDPAHRRRGVARRLIAALPSGRVFIEVRASNTAAQALYTASGFTVIGRRRGYYHSPPEDGIVMRVEK